MLWRQCWCQKCFQWGPGKGNQMAAVTGEHGWVLVHNRAVECSTELLSWQWSGVSQTLSKVEEPAEGQRLWASPGAVVTLCPVVSPRVEPHHMAALAWICASSGASHLQIWTRLHCLFNSGFFSVPVYYEVSFCCLCCLDLYRPLFSRWLLNSWGFYKTWWPRGEETV